MEETSKTTEAESESVTTILIAEDDDDIREVLIDFLQEETLYRVIGVSDGFAALKAVRTIIPHVFVLDYHLPSMDGLECLQALRAMKGLEHTPALLMSANFPKQIKVPPSTVILEKPFELVNLLSQLKQLLDG